MDDAAHRLGLDAGHLRRLCRDRFAASGLAKKVGQRWVVHPNADPRLRGFETWSSSDIRQIAELRREGVPAKYIRLAETKRGILLNFDRFESRARNDVERQRRYINSLVTKKVIPCEGIRKLTPRRSRQRAASSGSRTVRPLLESSDRLGEGRILSFCR